MMTENVLISLCINYGIIVTIVQLVQAEMTTIVVFKNIGPD